MKAGKVTQTVYRRSVYKQLQRENSAALVRLSQEEICFGDGQEGKTLAAQVSLYGNEKDLCVFAMARAVNGLAVRGARPYAIGIQILLPSFAYESRLKTMVELARQAADKEEVCLEQVDVQIVPGIGTTIVSLTCLGSVEKEQFLTCEKMEAGQAIVLLKPIGLEGTLRIKREGEAILRERFAEAYLEKIEAFKRDIFSVREMETAPALAVTGMQSIGDGGILAALWHLADGAGTGLMVDMRKILVRQETIEVCECFHLNPYQLASSGAVLLVSPNGEELVERFREQGAEAEVIGLLTEGNDRILRNGTERRYLERPSQDEYARFFEERQEEEAGC